MGETCLDWVGSWNSMLCTPVLKQVVTSEETTCDPEHVHFTFLAQIQFTR